MAVRRRSIVAVYCEAAARTWFGKACADLSPDEAAGLAGMIPNPRRINPRVNAARYERAKKRVLWLMANAGYLEKSVAGLGSAPPPPEVDADEDGVGGDDAADCLRYLVATKSRTVTQRKLRGL